MRTYSFAILRLTATSFSTPKSSKVCGVNASFLRVFVHIGHGAGPRVNKRSIHDSHLHDGLVSGHPTSRTPHVHLVVASADQQPQFGVQVSVGLAHWTLVVHRLRFLLV